MTTLPRPPVEWLNANGYVAWHELSRRQQAAAAQAYEYERTNGPPPPTFPAGSRGRAQWEYEGGDPLAVV